MTARNARLDSISQNQPHDDWNREQASQRNGIGDIHELCSGFSGSELNWIEDPFVLFLDHRQIRLVHGQGKLLGAADVV